MRVGSLFSGIGGFDLGLERAGMQIEWQVENNDYCREVLKKHWPAVPCHYDITTIDWGWIPRVDLVCGGFPCQPFSAAGKRRGADDDRYLWPEVVRCLAVLRPTWFLGENVYGLLHLGIEQMYADLEALGYQVAILGIPACAVDAPHLRKRIWILAHAESDLRGASRHDGSETPHGRGASVAYAKTVYVERQRDRSREAQLRGSSRWPAEPAVGRSSDGLPDWLDRHIGKGMSYAESQRAIKTLRALWKPHVAAAIWEAAGGLDRISQAEVLFALVREYKKDAHQTRLLLASQEALKTFVRGVWRATADASSSRRSRQDKQRSIEHSDAMQMVPRFHPRDGETPWPACGWEDGIARVAHGVGNRVDRLKGLGNAIVPQIAEALGRMILEVK